MPQLYPRAATGDVTRRERVCPYVIRQGVTTFFHMAGFRAGDIGRRQRPPAAVPSLDQEGALGHVVERAVAEHGEKDVAVTGESDQAWLSRFPPRVPVVVRL